MEKQLIAGAELDILYANVSQAARYFDGGWLTPASKLPNAEVILADLYPNIRDAWTYKGELLGLSYFTSVRGLPLVNLQKYYELGYTDADFPANWDALYDQIHEMPAKGIDQPYLPMWFNEWYGISWSFLFEVMNRGGQVADGETHEPMLTVDGPGGETLRDWKAAWNAGLIPKEVLSMKNSNNTEAFASGRFVFSPQAMYDLETFNNPERSQIPGHVTLLPYQGQSWGLLDSAMYLMTSRDRSDEHTADVMRFVNWYGYRHAPATRRLPRHRRTTRLIPLRQPTPPPHSRLPRSGHQIPAFLPASQHPVAWPGPKTAHGTLKDRSTYGVTGTKGRSLSVEPPWYGPVCPVVWEGRHREMPPYPDQSHFQAIEKMPKTL